MARKKVGKPTVAQKLGKWARAKMEMADALVNVDMTLPARRLVVDEEFLRACGLGCSETTDWGEEYPDGLPFAAESVDVIDEEFSVWDFLSVVSTQKAGNLVDGEGGDRSFHDEVVLVGTTASGVWLEAARVLVELLLRCPWAWKPDMYKKMVEAVKRQEEPHEHVICKCPECVLARRMKR